MRRSQLRTMASQTFLPVERDTFCRNRFAVRIMTTGARHSVARLFLALTLRQRLELTDRAQAYALLISKHKIANEVGKLLPRLKVINVSPRPLNRSLAFEMALHADRITPRGIEFGRINDTSAF
jgi:hypothetical protein